MANRPVGRQRVGGGAGKSVGTHGGGMGFGPVGRRQGYAGRGGSGAGGSGGRRSGGRSGGGRLILLIAVVLAVLVGGGTGVSSLFGGGGSDDTPATQHNTNIQSGASLSSLLGGFAGNASYSDGSWTGKDNTGRLSTSVASAARDKYTVLRGDGTDTATVMLYLCGTDLESKSGMATNDLKEIAAATASGRVNVLIYTGGAKQWKTRGISNTAHQIYVMENGRLRLLEKDTGGQAMTDPASLTHFIRFCAEKYPANRNLLILWDHGGGSVTGYGYDETKTTAGSMTLKKVTQALQSGRTRFDLIGFDACLMGTLETALAMAPYADYLLASEETEPGIGWYYTNWLTTLARDPATPTTTLGKQIADDFVSVCARQCPGQKATLSLVDLAELSNTVGGDLTAFAKATSNAIGGGDYAEVSRARADTREFGSSGKYDQVDLTHLALLLDTNESRALADTLLSAVKYNRVSAGMTDAYGLAAYFPYRAANRVSGAVQQLDAIGFDAEYTACVRKFASLEVVGQSAGGGSASPFGSLFGGGSVPSFPAGGVTDVISTLLGSGGGLASLLGDASVFDRSLDTALLAQTVTDVGLDNGSLRWTEKNGERVLSLTEAEWAKVANLQLNVFLDDGRGYIDLGLDSIFSFNEDGDLIGEYDGMWVALNEQPVAYYFTDQTEFNGKTVTSGRVPVLLNGERAELLISWTDNAGSVSGVRYIYENGETQAAAKAAALQPGDVIQPLCDRYTYDGAFEDAYMLGGEIVYDGSITVSDVTLNPLDGTPVPAYVLTDRFGAEHWTPEF